VTDIGQQREDWLVTETTQQVSNISSICVHAHINKFTGSL